MLNYQHPTHWNFPPACTAPLGASVTHVILKHARQPLLSVLHAAYLFLYRKWLNVLLYIAMFGNVCHIVMLGYVWNIVREDMFVKMQRQDYVCYIATFIYDNHTVMLLYLWDCNIFITITLRRYIVGICASYCSVGYLYVTLWWLVLYIKLQCWHTFIRLWHREMIMNWLIQYSRKH